MFDVSFEAHGPHCIPSHNRESDLKAHQTKTTNPCSLCAHRPFKMSRMLSHFGGKQTVGKVNIEPKIAIHDQKD